MRAIFLDRDGVVIRKAADGEYIENLRDVKILPGSLEAIASLCRAGYKVFFVTNQRGIRLGRMSAADVEEIHSYLKRAIEAAGGVLSGAYVCPHDYSDECDCRKPNPGMLIQAAKDHSLSLKLCWMVGDSATDVQAGKRAGCKTTLIARDVDERNVACAPDYVVGSLELFAQKIVASAI